MPLKFNNTEEARKLVLDESKKWRQALEKAKTSKDGVKDVAAAMVTATDTIVSAQVHTMDQVMDIKKEQGIVREGLEKANRAMDMLANEHDEIKVVVNKQEKVQETVSKDAEKAAYRAKAATVALYKLQLERSQSVVVIRNLAPLTKNKETYEDLEKLIARMLKELTLSRDGIRVNAVKRLQRSKMDKTGEYPALRVELSGVGDKIKIYQAIEQQVKSGRRVAFQISNEIPEYAIKAYKAQCKIATIIRRMDANVKTRVGIERGDLWPTISTKFRGAPKYERVPEQVFNTAKEVVIKEKKAENDKRKKEREDRLLEADEYMDTAKPGY